MRFTEKTLVVLLALGLSAAALAILPARADPRSTPSLVVLFDLGNGGYAWGPIEYVNDRTSENATWNVVLQESSQAGVSVQWTWYNCCGVYVTGIGGLAPPAGTGLFLWNATTEMWDVASVGLSSLLVGGNNTITYIALSNAAYDSVTYAVRRPVPTPLDPFPATQFRYDLANDGARQSYGPTDNRILWDRALPLQEIEATPAVGYGMIYVDTMDGFYALDFWHGTTAWANPAIKGLSSPALVNGEVLVGGTDGRLHALNATTGGEIWNVTLVPHPVFSGITSSPKVAYDLAYIGTFNETGGPGEVVAVWISNGTVAWRHATASIDFSSPAVDNGSVYIGLMGRYNTTSQVTWDPPYGVLALDAATGTQEWFFPTNDSVAASPIATAGTIVVPSKDGYLYAINRTTGNLTWRVAVQAGVSSPALAGNTIVVAGGSFGGPGVVHGVSLADGRVRWTFHPNGPVQGSVTTTIGVAYFATNVANGTVYAIDPATGALVWSYMPANSPTSTDYIFSSPVVADWMLVVAGDNGHVYLFGTENGVPTGPALTDYAIWGGAAAAAVAAAVAAIYLVRRRKTRGP